MSIVPAHQLPILYQDDSVLIINKPAGLPVHKGVGGGVTLTDYLDDLRFGLKQLPQLAHRLDRDTSGCLVLGRTPEALRRLGKLFAANQVQKTYWAVVQGQPPEQTGRIVAPLLRVQGTEGGFGFRMAVDAKGQDAATTYRVLGQSADGALSWLELCPETGRTHQLRVHCAHIGCPIIGDDKYGLAPRNAALLLHAYSLSLPLYAKREPIVVTAPPPASFIELARQCGLNE